MRRLRWQRSFPGPDGDNALGSERAAAHCTGRARYPRSAARLALKVLKAAGLPLHFSPHRLRHTFASLLLQQGESPAYVQRQLGHASIQLTVDTYGKWLPMGNKAAVNQLDDQNGSKVVAKTGSATPDTPEVADSFGGPSRTRTLDPLIKSQLLYQLS